MKLECSGTQRPPREPAKHRPTQTGEAVGVQLLPAVTVQPRGAAFAPLPASIMREEWKLFYGKQLPNVRPTDSQEGLEGSSWVRTRSFCSELFEAPVSPLRKPLQFRIEGSAHRTRSRGPRANETLELLSRGFCPSVVARVPARFRREPGRPTPTHVGTCSFGRVTAALARPVTVTRGAVRVTGARGVGNVPGPPVQAGAKEPTGVAPRTRGRGTPPAPACRALRSHDVKAASWLLRPRALTPP